MSRRTRETLAVTVSINQVKAMGWGKTASSSSFQHVPLYPPNLYQEQPPPTDITDATVLVHPCQNYSAPAGIFA
jgi:hypothetical protein